MFYTSKKSRIHLDAAYYFFFHAFCLQKDNEFAIIISSGNISLLFVNLISNQHPTSLL